MFLLIFKSLCAHKISFVQFFTVTWKEENFVRIAELAGNRCYGVGN